IFGTDYNKQALAIASEGIYKTNQIEKYASNYIESGGTYSIEKYFLNKYGLSKITTSLTKNISFHHHNLISDGVFSEFNLILCRNVLIYFDIDLQNRALSLFSDSLINKGILCLGDKESLGSEHKKLWKKESLHNKIFTKKDETFND
ncbi:protein-glutamate O-methyltransferase CheR, partial [bacterium]|nr:protein-glutamate O-methyltransferase CheR [bacterium]